MAFVLPIIGAIGTVASAGGIAAAVSTVGGFLSVAGGVLAGVGALTGKKDLVKLGGLFSLGSAASSAFGFAGKATGLGSSATGAAEALSESAGSIAGDGISASSMTDGIKGIGDTAAMKAPVNYGLVESANPEGLMFQRAAQLTQSAGAPSSLVGSMSAPSYGLTSGITEGLGGAGGQGLQSSMQGLGAAKALPASMQSLTQNDISSVLERGWQKVNEGMKNVGGWMRDNKELVSMGGQALASMYGPQAEQFDYQKSLMEQARRNLNQPIRLSMNPGR